MAAYTASKSLPPGRKVWVLSFTHPLRKDRRGKLGLKVRCSLETPDEEEAELVAMYRMAQGEHPDWDEYRAAMVSDRRVVARLRFGRAYGLVGG